MGHLRTDMTVRGSKAAVELKNVLIDTVATYTVLPEEILEQVGAGRIPTEVEIELGNGEKVKAKAYGVAITIEEVETPSTRGMVKCMDINVNKVMASCRNGW